MANMNYSQASQRGLHLINGKGEISPLGGKSSDHRYALLHQQGWQFVSKNSQDFPEKNNWKIHFSIDHRDVEKAFPILMKNFMDEKNGITEFKFIPKDGLSHVKAGDNRDGKEFVIYQHSNEKTPVQWMNFLQTVEKDLKDAGIRHGSPSRGDKPVPGCEFTSYRKDVNALNEYVEANDLRGFTIEKSFNLTTEKDIFADFKESNVKSEIQPKRDFEISDVYKNLSIQDEDRVETLKGKLDGHFHSALAVYWGKDFKEYVPDKTADLKKVCENASQKAAPMIENIQRGLMQTSYQANKIFNKSDIGYATPYFYGLIKEKIDNPNNFKQPNEKEMMREIIKHSLKDPKNPEKNMLGLTDKEIDKMIDKKIPKPSLWENIKNLFSPKPVEKTQQEPKKFSIKSSTTNLFKRFFPNKSEAKETVLRAREQKIVADPPKASPIKAEVKQQQQQPQSSNAHDEREQSTNHKFFR